VVIIDKANKLVEEPLVIRDKEAWNSIDKCVGRANTASTDVKAQEGYLHITDFPLAGLMTRLWANKHWKRAQRC